MRKADFHAITVEVVPPAPPNARARVLDCLHRAARWAPEVGEDIADAIAELIKRTDRRAA